MSVAPPHPGRRTTAKKSLTDAESRGWGKGWPTRRDSDMRKVSIPGADGRGIWVHHVLAPIIDHCLRLTVAGGYDLSEGMDEGGYECRPMKRADGSLTDTPSNHSWGTTCDLEWQHNPMSTIRTITNMPEWMPPIWEEWGFNWGGRWRTNGGTLSDAMHFEYAFTLSQGVADADHLLRSLDPNAPVVSQPDLSGTNTYARPLVPAVFTEEDDDDMKPQVIVHVDETKPEGSPEYWAFNAFWITDLIHRFNLPNDLAVRQAIFEITGDSAVWQATGLEVIRQNPKWVKRVGRLEGYGTPTGPQTGNI